jgi:hypothetical protein
VTATKKKSPPTALRMPSTAETAAKSLAQERFAEHGR